MEKLGYSLIDADNNEVWHVGDTKGQEYGLPGFVVLPNGDQVLSPSVGETLGEWRFVERWLVDEPPSPFYAVIGQSVAFDGTKIVVTTIYEDEPSITPPAPYLAPPTVVAAALGMIVTPETFDISNPAGGLFNLSGAAYLDVGVYWFFFTDPQPDEIYYAIITGEASMAMVDHTTDYFSIEAKDATGNPADPAQLSVQILRIAI
jgi:hypothetical protein